MKKTMTRTLSLVLTICLIAGLLVVPAVAAYDSAAAAVSAIKTELGLEDSAENTAIDFALGAPQVENPEEVFAQDTALKQYVQGGIEALMAEDGGAAVAVDTASYTANATETALGTIAYTATLTVGESDTANIGGTITVNKPSTEPETYQVSTDNTIMHGRITVTVDGEEATQVAAGATVTVTATADAHYELDKITVTKADDGTTTVSVNDDGTFTMPAYNVMVSATFKDAAYAITVTAGEHGSASASATEATMGTAITLTITPDGGYEVNAVTVNDNPLDAQEDGAYTFNMPGQAVTVNVTFRATQVTPPTKVDLSTKTVSLQKGDAALEGAPVVGDVLTAVVSDDIPAADVDFVWTVGDAPVADNATATYTVAAADEGKVIKVKAQAKTDSTTYENETPEVSTAAVEAAPLKTIVYTAEDVNVKYDCMRHAVEVNVTEPATGATVMYGEAEGSYTTTSAPASWDVVDKTVYFRITADGYETVTGSAKLTITKADAPQITLTASPSGVPAEGGEVTFTVTGVPQEAAAPTISCSEDGAIALTKQSDNTYTGTHTIAAATEAKTHTVTLTWSGDNYEAIGEVKCVVEQLAPGAVNKTALTDAITAANAAVEAIKVDTDAANVDEGVKWVTAEAKAAYVAAIGVAQGVLDNDNATQDEVDAAVTALATATTDFERAQDTGTKVPEATKYNVSVTDGTADKATAAEGESVTVTANAAPAGKVFDKWTATGLTLSAEDAAKAELTFTMPANDVALTATYKDETVEPADPAVKDASIVFITKDNYETLAPTYNYYGATAETLRPAADVQLPWLLVSYARNEAGTVTFAVTKDGKAVQFGSGDTKSATLSFEAAAANANAWISFHMVSQAETDHKDQTWLDQADAEGEYKVTVTMGEDTATATATYTKPEADKTELVAAIKAAQAMLDMAKTAESGAEILKADLWATVAEKAALKQAIAAAQTVADDKTATEEQVADAVTALDAAVEANLHTGEKDVTMDDLTAAVTAAKQAAEDITVAEDAASVKRGEEFVTEAVKADYDAAIAKAEAVTKNAEATAEEIEAALIDLNEATLVFNAAKQEGTKSASRPSGGGSSSSSSSTGNTTTNETLTDGTKRTTVTAKDGTVTVTDTKPDGTKTVTVTTPTGEITTDVTLGRNTESVQVAVPVDNANSGMVAVIIKPDGTEEIIRDSVVVDGEVIFDLDENAKVKIANKAKSFVDMPGHWAKSDVDFVSARDLFNGVSNTHFAPDATMTRGMMATVLYRLDGEGKVDKAVDFSDVAADDWFAAAVGWAAEIGMINGYTDGTFGPNRSITREELVVMIYRYAGAPAVEGQDMEKFDDAASVSDWATAAMTWAIQNGIINGKTASTIDPKGDATRAEVSAVLQRYVKLAK